MTLSCGIDVGSSAVKAAVVRDEDGRVEVLGRGLARIRGREFGEVVRAAHRAALAAARVEEGALDYVATTGEAENVDFRTGHFYTMTAQARGGLFLEPEARAVLDVGALHGRVIRMDARGKVLDHRMTSQCASGSGQFLENIGRYLGVSLEEIGALSRRAEAPEVVSSICAVLAETDVINMVSRGISTPNILKGIHLSMAGRLVKLLKSAKCTGVVLLAGGLARDEGLLAAMVETLTEQSLDLELRTHADSVYAGAIGAGIWGAFRHRKLQAGVAGA
jgi:benzoyl-CoA reductase subunit D